MPKVFISATSQDLKSYRDVVAQWATENGHEAVIQEEFPVQSDHGTIVQLLREQLDPCDAVIHLAGLYYGFEPMNRPEGASRLSYTQLEFELAKDHERQVFRFIARPEYEPDTPYSQSEEEAELQRQHRSRLMDGDKPFHEFSSHDELLSLLSRIDIKNTLRKPQNLPVVGSLFKGRDDFIEQLRSVLINEHTHSAAVTAKQAIHGLGGVGKTRVAVEYGRRFQHDYTALLFITADSPANLDRNLASLCGALVLNLPEKQEPKLELQVAAAVRWLRENSGWLLIIDNVDTTEAAEATEELLKRLNTGHVVVTSRLSEWGHALEELSLDVITETAAQEFLLERTDGKRKAMETDEGDASALAIDLGQLPLALEQAGAFIVTHRCTLQDYHTRWKKQESKVLEWHDQRTMKYPASVATTWQTSFGRLSRDARQLLHILCWLAPDPIPLSLFDKLPASEGDASVDIETAIANLAEYSFLTWTDSNCSLVDLHRVVAEITRYQLPECDRRNWLLAAMVIANRFIDETDPSDYVMWKPIYAPVDPHIEHLLRHAEGFSISNPTARLMNQLGLYRLARCQFYSAEQFLRHSLELREQDVPAGSPHIAAVKNNLAALLYSLDQLDEAEQFAREALKIEEGHYGTTSSKLLSAIGNLALIVDAKGNTPEAVILLRRGAEIAHEQLDGQDPALAIALSNLAGLTLKLGHATDAEPLMLRTLEMQERVYGSEHPNTSAALANLAQLFRTTNRPGDAEQMMRRALKIERRVFDKNHPRIAGALLNLAQLLRTVGGESEAEPLVRESLRIYEHAFQSQGANVAMALSALAILLQDTDRREEAEPHMRRALELNETRFGPEHPRVARDLHNLGKLLLETDRATSAETLLRRALAIDEKKLGSQHIDVARDLITLASCLATRKSKFKAAERNGIRGLRIYYRFMQENGHEHAHMRYASGEVIEILVGAGLSEEETTERIVLKLQGRE